MLSFVLSLAPASLTTLLQNASLALALRQGVAAFSSTSLELVLIAGAWDSAQGQLATFAAYDAVNQVGNRPEVSSMIRDVFTSGAQVKRGLQQLGGSPPAGNLHLGLVSSGLAMTALLQSGIVGSNSSPPTLTLCFNAVAPITSSSSAWTSAAIAQLTSLSSRPGDLQHYFEGAFRVLAAVQGGGAEPGTFSVALNASSLGIEFLTRELLAPSPSPIPPIPQGISQLDAAMSSYGAYSIVGGAAALVCAAGALATYCFAKQRSAKVAPLGEAPATKASYVMWYKRSPSSSSSSTSGGEEEEPGGASSTQVPTSMSALEQPQLHSNSVGNAATLSSAMGDAGASVPSGLSQALPSEDEALHVLSHSSASSPLAWLSAGDESSTLSELLDMPVTRELVLRSQALNEAGGGTSALLHPRNAPFVSRLPRIGRLVAAGARTLQAFQGKAHPGASSLVAEIAAAAATDTGRGSPDSVWGEGSLSAAKPAPLESPQPQPFNQAALTAGFGGARGLASPKPKYIATAASPTASVSAAKSKEASHAAPSSVPKTGAKGGAKGNPKQVSRAATTTAAQKQMVIEAAISKRR